MEFLPWIAILGFVITLIGDAAITLHSFSGILRNMQDTNRLVSMGMMRDPVAAQAYLQQQLSDSYSDIQVETVIDTATRRIETAVSIPWSALNLIGMLTQSSNIAVTFNAAHTLEWRP